MIACVLAQSISHVRLFATPWPVDHQASLSIEFSRQENWSRLPFPDLGDQLNAGTEPMSPMSSALAGIFFIIGTPGESFHDYIFQIYK